MRAWRWMVAVVLMVAAVSPVSAQRPPVTHPSNASQNLSLNFDRSSPPGDQHLWPTRTLLAYSHLDPALAYGTLYLTCLSNSSADSGRCPTSDTGENASTMSSVALLFRERRSGLRTELSLTGYLQRAERTIACSSDYWQPGTRPLWTSFNVECFGEPPVGTGVTLFLPAAELQKLVAGRWDAELVMRLSNVSGADLATYTFTFDLTITDYANASIYFPLYDQITPLVNLNIDYNPIGPPPTVGGRATLDMCLYDGLGSQVAYMEVTIDDGPRAAPGRPDGMYSVWHGAGGNTESDHLDYDIDLDYGGRPLSMRNGRMQVLPGIDTAQLRMVVLPGMSYPVYCVPTPLTLRTPRVPASTKAAGYYEGELNIKVVLPPSSP